MLTVKSSLGGFTSPYVYKIPADTVIFYNGTYSAPVDGWDIYTDAVGKFISGTATQGEVATTAAASGSTVSTAGSLSTAGDHLGSTVSSTGGAGSLDTNFFTAGGHTHTVTPASQTLTTELKPINTAITVLRTTTEQRFFPANTIHINSTNLVGGTQKIAATLPRYICGGTSVADAAATTHDATFSVSLHNSGTHSHTGGGTTYRTGATSGSSNPRYTSASTSTHSHTLTSSTSISRLRGKLLKLWIAASQQLPKSATVVMYCGNLSLLPPYWKVCDGTNGTIDMQGYFVGYASSSATAHDTVYGTATSYNMSGPTLATDNYTHAHYALSVSIYSFLFRPHGLESFPHTHALSGASLTTDAFPANIKLAFIQLVI